MAAMAAPKLALPKEGWTAVRDSATARVERYARPKIAIEVSTAGHDGRPGHAGMQGIHGEDGSGRTGSSGRDNPGGPGGDASSSSIPSRGRGVTDGRHAGNGAHGTNATNASNINIAIAGTPTEVAFSGSHSWAGNPGAGIILLQAHGGAGGHGGDGGHGGRGGGGGHGGRGGNGGPGVDASRFNERPGDGYRGGNGANGGDGANGGNGGNGGNAGHGGNGGNVNVFAEDPRLLSLVYMTTGGGRGGRGGAAGPAGPGGSAGNGGPGGSGGRGGRAVQRPSKPNGCPTGNCNTGNMGNVCPYCGCLFCQSCGMSTAGKMSAANRCQSCGKGVFDNACSDGRAGASGNSGRSGRSGNPGRSGNRGADGRSGVAGVALYKTPSESAATLYTMNLISYHVIDEDLDGIYEPGSMLYIDTLLVQNCGGLTLPPGGIAMPVAQQFATVEMGEPLPIPSLPVGASVTVPGRFGLRLGSMPQATGEPFVQKAVFSVGTNMLGRMFGTGFLATDVAVQYPVRLGNIYGPDSVGYDYPAAPGQELEFFVDVMNISKSPIEAMNLLLEIDVAGTQLTLPASAASVLGPVPPEGKLPIAFRVKANEDALLFSRHSWNARLLYKGTAVQTARRTIKIAAKYVPPMGPPSDVLFFVGPQVDLAEYTAWMRMFSGFGLSVDLWDVDGNFGISVDARTGQRHAVSWFGRHPGRLLVFPAHSDVPRRFLMTADIVTHLKAYVADQSVPAGRAGCGVLLYGANSFTFPRELFELSDKTATFGPEAFHGMHTPLVTKADSITEYTLKKKELAMAEKAMKADRLFRYGVKAVERAVKQENMVKFSYGNITLQAMPVPRSPLIRLVNLPLWVQYAPPNKRPAYDQGKWEDMTGYTRSYLTYHSGDELNNWKVWHDRFTVWTKAPPFPRAGTGAPPATAAVPAAARRAPPVVPGAGMGAGSGSAAAAEAAAVESTEGRVEAAKQAELSRAKLSVEPFDSIAVAAIPVPSRTAQAFTGLISALGIPAKVNMLIACCKAAVPDCKGAVPAGKWTFSFLDCHPAFTECFEISMAEAVAVCLYADIKNEFLNHVTGLPCLTLFVDTVCANPELTYKNTSPDNKQALMFLWGVLLRLKLGSRKLTQMFGDDKVTRATMIAQHRRFKDYTLGGYKEAKKAGAVYNPARKAAEDWATSKHTVKVRDMCATIQFPLYMPGEMESREREKQFRILYREKSASGVTGLYSETIVGSIGSAVTGGFKRLFAKRKGRKGDSRA